MFPTEIWTQIFDSLDLETCVALAETSKNSRDAFCLANDLIEEMVKERAPWMSPGCDGIEQATWSDCGRLLIARNRELSKQNGRFINICLDGDADSLEERLGEGIPIGRSTLETCCLPPDEFLVPVKMSLGANLSSDLDLSTLKSEAWEETEVDEDDQEEHPEFYKYGIDAFELFEIRTRSGGSIYADGAYDPTEPRLLENGSQALYSGHRGAWRQNFDQTSSGLIPLVNGHPDVANALPFFTDHHFFYFQTQTATFAYCSSTGGVLLIDWRRKAMLEIGRIEKYLSWNQLVIQEHNGLIIMRVYDYLLRFHVDLRSLEALNTLERSDNYPNLSLPVYEMPAWIHRSYFEYPEVVGYNTVERGTGKHKRFLVGKSPRGGGYLGNDEKTTVDIFTGTEYKHKGIPGVYLDELGLGRLGSYELSETQKKRFVDQAIAQSEVDCDKWQFHW